MYIDFDACWFGSFPNKSMTARSSEQVRHSKKKRNSSFIPSLTCTCCKKKGRSSFRRRQFRESTSWFPSRCGRRASQGTGSRAATPNPPARRWSAQEEGSRAHQTWSDYVCGCEDAFEKEKYKAQTTDLATRHTTLASVVHESARRLPVTLPTTALRTGRWPAFLKWSDTPWSLVMYITSAMGWEWVLWWMSDPKNSFILLEENCFCLKKRQYEQELILESILFLSFVALMPVGLLLLVLRISRLAQCLSSFSFCTAWAGAQRGVSHGLDKSHQSTLCERAGIVWDLHV